jgi:hydroxymethylpyrimidine/phosphomethylpyrimidine kinase
MKYDSDVRAAINIKYEPEIVNICKEMGLKASFYDRAEEPPEIKAADGKTIPWGIAKAVERVGAVPDVVYDFGDVGKEPMLFLLGASASDVAYVAIRIAREYWKRKSGMNV